VSEEMDARVPTSVVMQGLLHEAPPDQVSLGWVIERLGERSFGLLMFLLALIALVPGLSGFIGVLLMIPAYQMIIARHAPVLPRFIARRHLPTQRFARLIARTVPLLRRAERLIRPRWPTPLRATKRVVGGIIMLLGVTLIAPIPFSQVMPALIIMLVALAYLEEDGVVLTIALAVAVISLGVTAGAAWGTLAGIHFLDRFW
jgi:hypothetical protein